MILFILASILWYPDPDRMFAARPTRSVRLHEHPFWEDGRNVSVMAAVEPRPLWLAALLPDHLAWTA